MLKEEEEGLRTWTVKTLGTERPPIDGITYSYDMDVENINEFENVEYLLRYEI